LFLEACNHIFVRRAIRHIKRKRVYPKTDKQKQAMADAIGLTKENKVQKFQEILRCLLDEEIITDKREPDEETSRVEVNSSRLIKAKQKEMTDPFYLIGEYVKDNDPDFVTTEDEI
jgi:hypothetical protein